MSSIDREDTIKILKDLQKDHLQFCLIPFRQAIERVQALPSADRPQEWIPCSKRLPEDVQIGDEYPTVIFCTKENTYAGFYEYYLGGRWWAEVGTAQPTGLSISRSDGDYVVDDVIAWMPLPKPWKGADDE